MEKITERSGRYYIVDGKYYPSVTTIIDWVFNGGKSDRLVNWAVGRTCDYIESEYNNKPPDECFNFLDIVKSARKEAARRKEEAGDIGTRVHDLVEEWAKSRIDGTDIIPPSLADEDPAVVSAFEAFLDWAAEVNLEPVESEKSVASRDYHFAGTRDLVAYMNTDAGRRLFLIDVKTSSYFYDVPMGAQLAAYLMCEPYFQDKAIDDIGVLRLDKKTGKPHFRSFTAQIAEYAATFMEFKKIYDRFRAPKGKDYTRVEKDK